MSDDPIPLLFLIAIVASPLILIFGIRRIKRNTQLSPMKRELGIFLLGLLMLPFLGFVALLLWFGVTDFPFTSSVIVHTTAPTGEEVCVIQISDIIEYSVSLYAHRPGEPWVWHFIDGDDDRWRSGRVEFSGDEVRVYQGSKLRRTIAMSQLTVDESESVRKFPADYTPQRILGARGR